MTDQKDEAQAEIRKEYGGTVLSIITLTMFGGFVLSYIMPYLLAAFGSENQLGLSLTIPANETYNILIASILGFWIRGKISIK